MIKTVIKAIYFAVISIFLFSIILAALTGYAFIFQTTKSSEISYFIQDIYESQKIVIIDVFDLSKLLLKDTSEKKPSENNNLISEAEFSADLKSNSKLDESSIPEDSGNNPLGIVIEPTLSEVRENKFPVIRDETRFDKESELSMDEMEMS
tara:strand:+ start:3095 stop:3547 length:453 start_codon:yes stop_codon:yes gene_type:complete